MPVSVFVRSASPERGPGAQAGEGRPPSLTFDGDRVVIGRGAGSDVRLPDPSVSSRHATLRASGADYAIVDEGSTNGTWVGGVRLAPNTPRLVRNGDLVRLGRVWIELAVGQRPPTPDLGMATRDLALALVRRAMDAIGDDTVPRLVVVEGPDLGAELRLEQEGRAYVIGRAEGCDLPLADADASREHAVVVRRGGSVLLRDNDAKNGVWLGEQRLAPGRDVAWRPPLVARLGVNVLALEEPVGAALAELESAVDERIRDEDAPPPPAPLDAPKPPDGDDGAAAPAPAQPSRPAPSGAATAEADAAPARRTSVPPPAPPPPPAAVAGAIAEVAAPPAPAKKRARRGWTPTDLLVVAVAVAVIAASLAGLVWIVRGG